MIHDPCLAKAAKQIQEDELALRGFSEPCWYRIEYSDGFIRLRRLPVLRHTPKGAWLDIHGSRKFVPRDRKYRGGSYAAPSVEQAEIDFKARKAFQILMLEKRLRWAKDEVEALSNEWRRAY